MKIIKNVIFLLSVIAFVIFGIVLAYIDNSVPSKTDGYSFETKYYYEDKGELGAPSSYSLKEAEVEFSFGSKKTIKLVINEDAENDSYISPIKVVGTYEIKNGYLYVDFEDLHIYKCIGKINAYTFNPNSNLDSVVAAILISENPEIKSPISDLSYLLDSDEIIYENEETIEARMALIVCMTVCCIFVIVCVIWTILLYSRLNKSKSKNLKAVEKIEKTNENMENV